MSASLGQYMINDVLAQAAVLGEVGDVQSLAVGDHRYVQFMGRSMATQPSRNCHFRWVPEYDVMSAQCHDIPDALWHQIEAFGCVLPG